MRSSPLTQLLAGLLAAPLLLSGCAPSEADRKSLQDGFAQYSARQFDSAEAAATGYIQKNPAAPNLDEALYLRGLTRYSRGNKPAAAEDLQNAIAKSNRPDLKAKACRALGDIAYDVPHWPQALDYYQKSITFVPEGKADAHSLYRIGACLQCLGQWDPARPFFQRVAALKTDPILTQRAVARMNARNFALQFGAFQEAAKAAELLHQLKTAGISASATTELREAQLLYLVRAGNYPTWEEADRARSRLLTKYPVISVVP